MSMFEAIVESAGQFGFEPKVIDEDRLGNLSQYIVVGMGGSHLAAGIVKMWKSETDIIIHQNYGLPKLEDEELKKRLIILSSYSGNTEEVIDAYKKAGESGLARAVITVGGELLDLAKRDNVAYIQMPDTGIQPRAALGFSLVSFLKILGQKKLLSEVKKLETDFHPQKFEEEGKKLAKLLKDRVPVIYTAAEREILGYIWKISFNETGKIPAFNNVIPELNHNEMNGFDVKDTTAQLSNNFTLLFLEDESDPDKIKKRMEITAKLYASRNLNVRKIKFNQTNSLLRLFNSIALAEFTAYYTAQNYSVEAEEVPMIEEFKKML